MKRRFEIVMIRHELNEGTESWNRMMPITNRKIEKQLDAHRASLSRQGQLRGEQLLQERINDCYQAIEEVDFSSLNVLGGRASSIANIFGMRGLIDLADNKQADAIGNLSTSIEVLKWAVRVRCRFHFNLDSESLTLFTGQFPPVAIRAALLLAYSIALDNCTHERELYCYLSASINRLGTRVTEFWMKRRLEPLLVFLYCLFRKLPCPIDIDEIDLKEYAPLLDSWEDDARLPKAMSDACDYHLRRMENTRTWDAEFGQCPFDLFPVEIHAMNLMRDRIGLGRVQVPHALMQFCPVWTPVPVLPEVVPLIEAIKEKLRRTTPEDGDDRLTRSAE